MSVLPGRDDTSDKNPDKIATIFCNENGPAKTLFFNERSLLALRLLKASMMLKPMFIFTPVVMPRGASLSGIPQGFTSRVNPATLWNRRGLANDFQR